MHASKLVEQLQKLMKEHGDQPLVMYSDEMKVPVAGVAIGVGKNDEAYEFEICDTETMEAYS